MREGKGGGLGLGDSISFKNCFVVPALTQLSWGSEKLKTN